MLENIIIDKDICFGKPCVKGTRISVDDIHQWLLEGISEKEILSDYPLLTLNDIEAVKKYKELKKKD